jgi:GDP-D-mannose 3',5'-epimerase
MKKKTALVLGAGGFIGGHMVKRLKAEGYWVRGVDIKEPEFSPTAADEFLIENLTWIPVDIFTMKGGFDEVYQFAADMGGAGYIFSGDSDADIFDNSMRINLNTAELSVKTGVKKLFFSSSACIYPQELQTFGSDIYDINLKESSAYPANPDSIYGWEKLVAERMYDAYRRNYGLDIRIGRFHNIFGPEGTYEGGREKAPAAICRKVALAREGESIEIWGDGEQTRSFLYIDECIEGVRRLMASSYYLPLNIGSSEMVSINKLVDMTLDVSDKKNIGRSHDLTVKTLGVRGRNSDNTQIEKVLGWKPNYSLSLGLKRTYDWVAKQVQDYTPQGFKTTYRKNEQENY